MTNVIDLEARRSERMPIAACGCSDLASCYPHRVAKAADLLRSMPADLFGDAWVMRGDVREAAGVVLALLDQITAECLPDQTNGAAR